MRDPLLNYIEENKDELDVYTPSPKNWDEIQGKINATKKNKKRILYAVSMAAVLLIGLFIVNQNSLEVENNLTQIETRSDFEVFEDSITFRRTENINWEQNKPFEIQTYSKDGGFKGVQMNIGSGDLTYMWVPSGYYESIKINENLASSGTNATQYFTLTDNSSNGCTQDEGLKTQSNSNSSYGRTDYVQPVQYEVDRYYEQYDPFEENQFETPLEKPLSTFGIDVDGAAYSNMRRFIQANYLPPKNAIKLEEMVNYFNYDLPEPKGKHPFSITTEVGECPWNTENLIMQIALKGERIEMDENQSNNLVFLIDVSGSMNSSDKLPLLKKSLNLLVNEMGADDRVAIVVYAGAAGLVLPSTSGKYKSKIYDAIENLSAGGSTAGGAGIELAYGVANSARLLNGNNRVILATDGDFNVGVSNDDALVKLIEKKRESGISLSVLGFGTGNLQSSKMEKLADNGNGNYNYIDNLLEAKKVLVDELGGTLITIAKDVKLQLEFNPEHVKSYRLLGYENRLLTTKDFSDDKKDAGDLGSGHTVVALYEIVPNDSLIIQKASNLRYQKKMINNSNGLKEELAIVKFRYKQPNSSKSKLIEKIVTNTIKTRTSKNFQFASAVAEFGMIIRESKYKGVATFDAVIARAKASKGLDEFGYRAEFIRLVEHAKLLMNEYYDKRSELN